MSQVHLWLLKIVCTRPRLVGVVAKLRGDAVLFVKRRLTELVALTERELVMVGERIHDEVGSRRPSLGLDECTRVFMGA